MTHTQYLHPDIHTTEEKPECEVAEKEVPTRRTCVFDKGELLDDASCTIMETDEAVAATYQILDNPSRAHPFVAVENAIAHWTAKHPGRPLQVVPLKYRTITDQVTENGRRTMREQQTLSQYMVVVVK